MVKRGIYWLAVLTLSVSTCVAGIVDDVKKTKIKGGIIVHLGCADGKETAKLRLTDNIVVQGLDTNKSNIDRARKYISSQKLYGKVTANIYNGKTLPYADSLVNVIVWLLFLNLIGANVLNTLCSVFTT